MVKKDIFEKFGRDGIVTSENIPKGQIIDVAWPLSGDMRDVRFTVKILEHSNQTRIGTHYSGYIGEFTPYKEIKEVPTMEQIIKVTIEVPHQEPIVITVPYIAPEPVIEVKIPKSQPVAYPKIREIQKAKKLSQQDLAQLVGMPNSTLSYKIAGKSPMTVPELKKIADTLEVSVHDLL